MFISALGSVLLMALMTSACPTDAADDVLKLTDKSCLAFASIEEGRKALVRDDDFVRSLSRFDLESRLQTTDQATRDAWQALVADQVLSWEQAERQKLRTAFERLKEKLARFDLPWPEQILLIHTTGKEEGGAAYCRGASIVLPKRMLDQPEPKLDRLLAHELFHVLSNQNPKLRTQLYAIIGFHVMPPLELPPSLKDRRITNPDAPLIDCWIALEHEGRKVRAAPVLYASPERYDPTKKRTFFEYLTFRMLILKDEAEGDAAALQNGEPVLIDPRDVPSYFAQIGRNTNYIIHPDEILADNFAHLVIGGQDLATPRVVEELDKALKR